MQESVSRTIRSEANARHVADHELQMFELEERAESAERFLTAMSLGVTAAGSPRTNGGLDSRGELERLRTQTERQAILLSRRDARIAELEHQLVQAESATRAPAAMLARVTQEKAEALDRVAALQTELASGRASVAVAPPRAPAPPSTAAKASVAVPSYPLDFGSAEGTHVSVVQLSDTALVDAAVGTLLTAAGRRPLGFFPVQDPAGPVVALGLSGGSRTIVFMLGAATLPASLERLLTSPTVQKVGCGSADAADRLAKVCGHPFAACEDLAPRIGLVFEPGKLGKMVALTIFKRFNKMIGAFPRRVNPELARAPWTVQSAAQGDPVVAYIAFIAWAIPRVSGPHAACMPFLPSGASLIGCLSGRAVVVVRSSSLKSLRQLKGLKSGPSRAVRWHPAD
jgi:hypothetical protein